MQKLTMEPINSRKKMYKSMGALLFIVGYLEIHEVSKMERVAKRWRDDIVPMYLKRNKNLPHVVLYQLLYKRDHDSLVNSFVSQGLLFSKL